MKTTRFILLLLTIFSLSFLVSCDKEEDLRPQPVLPEPEPEPEPEPDEDQKPDQDPDDSDDPETGPVDYPDAEDTYCLTADQEFAFKSVAMMMIGENIAIAATPDEGFTDVTAIMEESSEYFFAAVNPMMLQKETDVDLLTEESLYTIISTLQKAPLETVAPENTDEIKEGRFMVSFEEGILTFKAGIILSDDTRLGIHLTAEENADTPIEINKNTIVRGDEAKPLRAAFSAEKDGLLYLYLTPANIFYFSELDIATWYLYLVLPTSKVTGEKTGTDEITSDDTFMFGMVDNVTADNCFDIDSSMLSEINGVFDIEKTGEYQYNILFSFTIGGIQYHASYEGECKSVEEEAPVVEKESFFTCGKEKNLEIDSAELEKGENTWTLHLNVENGKTASVTMPADFFDRGGVFGFSQDPSMCVIYDETTYSKANGYSGTITMYLNEEDRIVEVEFTNYKDCELYYYGTYTAR